MDFAERRLYHQIHPAKIATDLAADIAGTILLWHHRLAAGLTASFLPPVVASALLMRTDLTPYQNSAAGAYLRLNMTPTLEAVRLGGFVLHAVGAWRRRPWLIAAGQVV